MKHNSFFDFHHILIEMFRTNNFLTNECPEEMPTEVLACLLNIYSATAHAAHVHQLTTAAPARAEKVRHLAVLPAGTRYGWEDYKQATHLTGSDIMF
ncbi:hypothetical protein PoB_001869300 [Plakobranchus ocellatus]|uniref:Uncharacterized protein n=1 Tax=Plakobranchus ocellatus TaxID=259542 RepID=A0AAV3ZC80_9GAST|nr:hypothetical protein PoB_001869300 [Plakobranchus ocellatus]